MEAIVGILNKFGSSGGSGVEVPIIAAFSIPANQFIAIAEFGTTLRAGGSDGVYRIQSSADDFILDIVEHDRIEMPQPGDILKTYKGGIKISAGATSRKVRVMHVEAVGATTSVTITGQTSYADVNDQP